MNDYRTRDNKKPTMSHTMVFIILLIYVLMIIVGIGVLFIGVADNERAPVLYSLLSYSGVCGTATIWVYVGKAKRENEIKISNDIYRMKLELAAKIYSQVNAGLLDEKSIALIKLLDEDNKQEDTLSTILNNASAQIQTSMPINSNDDGLG